MNANLTSILHAGARRRFSLHLALLLLACLLFGALPALAAVPATQATSADLI